MLFSFIVKSSYNILKRCRGLPVDERQSAAELDAIMQRHHNLQEKLAEDMLNLARNLKNNTLAAQNIIKQDNQVALFNMRAAEPKGAVGFISWVMKVVVFWWAWSFFSGPVALELMGLFKLCKRTVRVPVFSSSHYF